MRFQFTWLGLTLAVAFAAFGLVACGRTNSGEAGRSATHATNTTASLPGGVAGTTAELSVESPGQTCG